VYIFNEIIIHTQLNNTKTIRIVNRFEFCLVCIWAFLYLKNS